MVEAPNHVQRLRKAADEMRRENQNGWPLTCDAAADEIESLQSQIAELRAEVDVQRQSKEYAQRCCEAAEAENARLRALPLKDEVERELRKAHDDTMGQAGEALLDKSVDGRIKANWLGGKANGLATALDILSRLRAGGREGWRDMPSAPRDGTRVDLWIVTDVHPAGRRAPDAYWNINEGEWQLGQYHAGQFTSRPLINGWMPLPASPSEQGGDRG